MKYRFGDQVEFVAENYNYKSKSDPVKHKKEDVHHMRNGGYVSRVLKGDLQPGTTYILEKRTYWWVLIS